MAVERAHEIEHQPRGLGSLAGLGVESHVGEPQGSDGRPAEDADLRPQAAFAALTEKGGPGHSAISVVRMELELRTVALESGEVLVRVQEAQLEHARIERDAPRDVANNEIQTETGERPAVIGGAHPGLGLSLLHISPPRSLPPPGEPGTPRAGRR